MTIVSDIEYTTNITNAKEILSEKIQDIYKSFINCESEFYNKQYVRIQINLKKSDILNWLHSQESKTKFYWSDRESRYAIAGVGYVDYLKCSQACNLENSFNYISRILKNSTYGIKYYGGFQFDSNNKNFSQDIEWNSFGSLSFVLPRFELISDNKIEDYDSLYLNFSLEHDTMDLVLNEINKLNEPVSFSVDIPDMVSRMDIPDKNGWISSVESALTAFEQSQIEKVVLARKTIFGFNGNINPFAVQRELIAEAFGCYNFYFQFESDVVFLGVTPERLYYRKGNNISTEAVAGTRPRGYDDESDNFLSQQLLNSPKEILEHCFVLDSIKNILNKICSRINNDAQISLLKLTKVQHLITHFDGHLNDSVSDADIIGEMHPTPAVGGVPKDKSLQMIDDLEPFERGWYAGPVGWIGKDSAEFAVAIRSGLINKNCLFLYSGAGIVKGSCPDDEWREIENKLSNFIKAVSKQ